MTTLYSISTQFDTVGIHVDPKIFQDLEDLKVECKKGDYSAKGATKQHTEEKSAGILAKEAAHCCEGMTSNFDSWGSTVRQAHGGVQPKTYSVKFQKSRNERWI